MQLLCKFDNNYITDNRTFDGRMRGIRFEFEFELESIEIELSRMGFGESWATNKLYVLGKY